jgi:hypothetical protein
MKNGIACHALYNSSEHYYERGEPGRSHSANFDHRRRPETLRTAMAMAFFCPTNTTSRLPQVDRHQRRNDGAANIDRNHRAFAMANNWHGVSHAEEIDVVVGHGMFRRQLRDRDVERTADQSGEEQENRGVGNAETHRRTDRRISMGGKKPNRMWYFCSSACLWHKADIAALHIVYREGAANLLSQRKRR